MRTKVVFFTGGVHSSLGKGLTLSSVGRILVELGFKVSVLKIDPYLNLNSGKIVPFQHGEAYVTPDGHEADLDLGNYERIIDCPVLKHSHVTAGDIYKRIIERQSDETFSKETIQVVPHVIDEIHISIENALSKSPESDFLFVEIGGTVGDVESNAFIDAAYRFKEKYGENDVAFIHLSPIFYLKPSNEYKTKPAQHSIRELAKFGIKPDILVIRSERTPPEGIKNKFLVSSRIPTDDIVFCLDNESLYLIVEDLYDEKIHEKILGKFGMSVPPGRNIDSWKTNTKKIKLPKNKKMSVVIVGEYSNTSDEYISVSESLKLASYILGIDLRIDCIDSESLDLNILSKYGAVCMPCGSGMRGIEGKIKSIEYCRNNKIPFLGICFGMQLACIEYARNALNIKDADSFGINSNSNNLLFIPLPENLRRLGDISFKVIKDTKAYSMFQKENVISRHRHKYYLNPDLISIFEGSDLIISGISEDNLNVVEIVELKNHPFFIATQYRPEFDTRFMKVSPLFTEFLKSGLC